MTGYDFDRPYIEQEKMLLYEVMDEGEPETYGQHVRATKLSNLEYKTRYSRFKATNNMKPPPSALRIFSGYLVVRKLGTPAQYETWMPEDVFETMYRDIAE
jgi:hypothetical protein